MKYYWAIKRNKVPRHDTTSMNLVNRNERGQSQRTSYILYDSVYNMSRIGKCIATDRLVVA